MDFSVIYMKCIFRKPLNVRELKKIVKFSEFWRFIFNFISVVDRLMYAFFFNLEIPVHNNYYITLYLIHSSVFLWNPTKKDDNANKITAIIISLLPLRQFYFHCTIKESLSDKIPIYLPSWF